MKDKIKDLLRDTVIFTFGSLGSKLILFLMVPLYTNSLTRAEYGTAELIFSISQLIIPVFSVVIWNGIIRYGLKKENKQEDTLLVGIVVWICGSCLLALVTPLFHLYQSVREWRWYLYVYSSMHILNLVLLNYLKVKDKNKLFAIVGLLQTFSLAICNVFFLVVCNQGVRGYLISYICANSISIVLAFTAGNIKKDLVRANINKQLAGIMLRYSAPLIINDVSWWVINSSDKIMVETMVDTAALGVYTAAIKIPSLINTFINVFIQAWRLSSIKEVESKDKVQFYSHVLTYYSFFVVAVAILIILFIKPFMSMYVGKDFVEAWKYVPLLLLASVFSAINSYFGSIYGAIEKSFECMITSLMGGAVNIVLNYFLILEFGIWGAVIATVASYIIVTVIRTIRIVGYIHIKISWMEVVINLVLVSLQAVLVSADRHIVAFSLSIIVLFWIVNRKKTIKIYSAIKAMRNNRYEEKM